MTATKIVGKLWRKVFGTGEPVYHVAVENLQAKYANKKFNSAWDRWENRNRAINGRGMEYSRNRDFVRAFRQNDLRLAAELDRIAEKNWG